MIIHFRTFVLFLLFFTVIFPVKSYAVPAYDGFFVLKQPSGLSFEARQFGDEWYNWVETKDGYGIFKNTATGKWEYYLPSADTGAVGTTDSLSLHRSSSHAVVGEVATALLGIPKGLHPSPKKLPDAESDDSPEKVFKHRLDKKLKSPAVSGTLHLLAIGVDYSDTPATYTAEQIQLLLFGTSNSFSDYYSKVSYSSVTITPATETQGTADDGFIGWLRLGGNHPNKISAQIAKDAILAADSYIDYASYDSNEDGVIDPTELSVIVIVAGYEKAYDASYSPAIWAHWGSMGGVGYPSIDGKTIKEYAQFGEKHGDHLATIGVIVHEVGHLMFSLPDLYDTDTSNGDSGGMGYFDLMSSGSWGTEYGENAGSSPTQISAWCKEYLSWGTVNTVSSNQSVSFPKSDGNNSSVFRINTSDSNQYFLIENREFTGYDTGFQRRAGASGHGGLVIYHIDTLKINLWPSSNKVNADVNDKGVDVEEANEGSLGYSMLDTLTSGANTDMFFFSGNNTSFTDSTTPDSKLKNGDSTNISITDISTYGDNMTAAFTLPVRPPTVITGSATNLTSDLATLNGTVTANGAITTVWFEYDTISGSYSNTTSTQSLSESGNATVSIDIDGLLPTKTYYYRIAAQNSAGIAYGTEMSFSTPDTTPPAGSITINNNDTYTNSPVVTLTLSATDDVGVTGYYISTSSDVPSASSGGWTSITSNNAYSADVSYTLSSEDDNKVIYVWYKDASGNISNTASDSITLDTTVPTITITSPTSDSSYTAADSTTSLGGSATDNLSGISNVAWSNSNGESGIASGTTGWSISNINLSSGDNVITVTVTDNAGNVGTDMITVTYVCNAKTISVSSNKLNLKRKENREVIVTLTGEDTCLAESEIVATKIDKAGKKRISISPPDGITDSSGQVTFIITSKNNIGKAKVTVESGDLRKTVTVNVKK